MKRRIDNLSAKVWDTIKRFRWTLFPVVIFIIVFLLLYVENPDTEKGGFAGFIEKRASDILMAILVAFLGSILVRIEIVKNELNRHRTQWAKSCQKLQDLERNLSSTQEVFMSSVGFVEAMKNIYDAFLGKDERNMLTPILEKSTKLVEGWAKYISPQAMGAGDESERRLEQMCWKFAFDSYMEEEYRDIAVKNRVPGEPPGPTLATNYPTYLDFLRKISDTFTTEATEAGFKPCFLSLANTFPIEWVMISDRRRINDNFVFECETNRKLVEWRTMSAELAKHTEGTVFRRIFLTTDSPDVWNNLPIPRLDVFKNQHDLYVWTLRDDRKMEVGLKKDIWEKIADETGMGLMDPNINIRHNCSGVFVSNVANTEKSRCTVEEKPYVLLSPAKSLRKIVVDELHKPPFDLTAMTTNITKSDLARYDLRPTDLLIIGLLHNEQELNSEDHLIGMMTPLIGVECRARDPWSNISVLSLYSSRQIKDSLRGWIDFLEEKSKPLDRFLRGEIQATGGNK